MESARAMTGDRERGSRAELKNCEILLLPTAERRFDTKVKFPTGRASFWVKFPTERNLMRVKCPGIAGGGGMGGFGIDWYIILTRKYLESGYTVLRYMTTAFHQIVTSFQLRIVTSFQAYALLVI